MKFLEPKMAEEYRLLPEALRLKLEAADAWLVAQGWPDLFLTCVGRSDDDSERIYTPYAEAQAALFSKGLLKTDKEKVLGRQLAAMTPEQRKAWARKKFSWHRCLCAVDIRNRIYSRTQRKALMDFLRKGTNTTEWELLEHDVGRGDHIHASRRDFGQRKRYGM